MAAIAEIRRHRRYPVRKIVSCQNGGKRFLALTVNLSLGGMKIEPPHPLETNEHLNTELVLDRKVIPTKGRVVYAYSDTRNQLHTGIEFVEISEDDRKALKAFLMSHERSPEKRQPLFKGEEQPVSETKDTDKSAEQLLEELGALRDRLGELEWERKESRRAFQALDETEQRFQELAELLPVGVAEYDLGMNLRYANRFLYEMFGYTEEDFKRRTDISQVLAPEELERARKAIERIASGEAVGSGEYRLVRKGGKRLYGEVHSVAIVRDGVVVGIRSVVQEITDRKHTEVALRESHQNLEKEIEKRTLELARANQELRKMNRELERRVEERTAELAETGEIVQTIVDNIPVMLYAYDASGNVRFVNQEFERKIGFSLEEAQEVDVMAECYPDRAYRKEVWEYMMKATSEWRDFKVRCRNGKYLESSWANVRLSDGSQIGIGIDITKRRRTEETLRESQRRLRKLSSQLLTAHEDESRRVARDLHDSIGSALATIRVGLSRRLERIGDATPPQGVSLDDIMDAVNHAIRECGRIQMGLRPSILDDIGLLATIDWHCREFGKRCPHVQIQKQIEAEESRIPEFLKIVMYRIVQESLNNVHKHSQADLVNLCLRRSDEAIEICIQDNGQGFDPREGEILGHAKGMGLGSMRERVEISGGSFRIESGKGRGTAIQAVWPCKDKRLVG